MSFETAIKVEQLSKCYQIYDHPRERLKQFILPRVQRLVDVEPKSYFREFWALKEVSFEVRKGETVGIIGQNGSGKSTLLQMICGTLNPTTGKAQTIGRIAALLELGSGFNPEFTGRENVYLNASILGLSRLETDERFDEIADFADIGLFIEQPVKTYSSGMIVRLAFAVAINVQPQVLIIDEALSVGDELFQRKCFSRIEAIKNAGATILFVSHSGATIVDLCDRAILLDEGELIGVGRPKTIVAKYQKLLYSPEHERSAVRQEIIQSSPVAAERAPFDSSMQALPVCDAEEEFFDAHLMPQSTISYESHGAHISNPTIKNNNAKQVNNLARGGRYTYCYQATFSRTLYRVRFGMVIRTTSGVSLGGALSATVEDAIPLVKEGTKISIEFAFDCHLNPGTYFLNAGIFGSTGQDETVVHRLVDAAAFRVSPIANNLATEAINFSCSPTVKIHA